MPLFLVSAAAVGLETALTRYFALANWSDYGYWVISIVMVGFAFAGVTLALAEGFFTRHAKLLLAALPAALTLSAALGYAAVILNPFNPLALQNQATWLPQLRNIGLYYLALLPFFYLTGLFISLCFSAATTRLGKVYAADMLGAAAGTVLVLGLMFLLPAFALTAWLLPLLALAALFTTPYRKGAALAALLALGLGEALLAFGPQAEISQYKPIYPPLHTPSAKILATLHSPRGEYMLLDDFTERVNTDISNDSAMLGYPSPPLSYGLYRDGIRIASLPRPGAVSNGYAPGALDALPYTLRPQARALLIGTSGGFKADEVLALGAAHVDALETEPMLYRAIRQGFGPAPALAPSPRLRIFDDNPRSAVRSGQHYDVIDIASDALDSAPANVYAFSAQAFAADLDALTPGGVLSVPVSIQDFPAYALRLLATMREAYRLRGIDDAGPYLILYRSAWNARLLASNQPFSAADIKAAAKWTDDRSFDVSYYQGFDPVAARDNLYNDLPAVSFANGTADENAMDDSIADEAAGILAGQPTVSAQAFDLRPVTDDRPAFYAILRLNQLSLLLARLQILPQAEIGALVNLAVLAQAVVIAALVLLVPLAAPKRERSNFPVPRPALYFSALAIGYMFLEIFSIERVSLLLNDRATAFSVVLSVLLAFSGLGSFLSGRFAAQPSRAVAGAFALIAAWGAVMMFAAGPACLAGGALPYGLRILLVVLALAPVSLAMGMPFPLGLERVRAQKFFLPWAWGLNGALSVVAPPLANLLLRNIGLHAVLGGAILLYAVAALCFPVPEGKTNWLPVLRRSAAVD
ncbi:MAG TPA: hypothetical protein VEQ16_10795 [Acidocella sp.]|nr:hypothetical protein [Acidocella sp.]